MKQDASALLLCASRKIAVKPLDREQILSSLPDYDQLYHAVQMRRRRQNKANGDLTENTEQSHLMHDNIMAIFGGRGSGKTSVLLSLRQQLVLDRQKRYNGAGADIILPIISPEIISENSTMLSWVLAMFQGEIEALDKQLKEHPKVAQSLEQAYGTGVCELRTRQSFLRREYDNLMRESGSSRIFREMHRYEYEDLLKLQAQHSKEQYQLMHRLRKFWGLVVEVQKALNPGQSPLIFIMFDDIDLAPERSMELLMSAYKYFSSPHVVIVLTAAKKTLHQVLTYRMYEKVVGSDFTSLIQGNDIQGYRQEVRRNSYRMDRASESAIEYLNKVIPQSSRYELNRFDTYDKKLTFRYPLENPENGRASIPLGEFVVRCIAECGLDKDYGNFVQRIEAGEDQAHKNMAREYYLLFGNKSRYITNACLGILNTCEQLGVLREQYSNGQLGDDDYVHTLFYTLRHCLSVLINSHTRSMEECGGWLSYLFRYEYGDRYLVVDYRYLIKKYRECLHEILESVGRELAPSRAGMSQDTYWIRYDDCLKEKKIELRQKISVLFSMLFFVEHLVTCMLKPEIAGGGAQNGGLNSLLTFLNESAASEDGLTLFPVVQDMERAMDLYGELLEEMQFEQLSATDGRQVEAYFSYISTHPYFMELIDAEGQEERNLYRTCNNNPEWVRSLCTMLYLTQSGIQLIDEKFFGILQLFFQDVSVLPGLHDQIKVLEMYTQEFVLGWNILDWAELHLRQLQQFHAETVLPSQKKTGTVAKNCSWKNLCEEVLKDESSTYISMFTHNMADSNDIWEDSSIVSLAQVVCNRVERLVRECSRDMVNLHMGMTLKKRQVDDVHMLASSLCEVFPEAEPMGRAIIRELEQKYQTKEEYDKSNGIQVSVQGDLNHVRRRNNQTISIDSTNALRFLLQCNMTYRVANRQKGSEIVGAYYRSLIHDFADQMKLTVSAGQMKGVRSFLVKLKTIETMLPYYFSARFILANAARYDELHLGQEGDKTRGGVVAATVYHDFLQAITQQEYSVLRGFMVEARAKYTAELHSSFEVAT